MTSKVKIMCQLSLLLCMLIILAQIKIDLGYVPVTLQTLGIYLIALLTKPKYALYVSLCYVFMGVIGLPVFAGLTGGIGALIHYNGGYIVAFPLMCFVTSCLGHDQKLLKKICGCIVGTLICYIIGTAWFIYITKMDVLAAVMLCIVPFLTSDALKIAAAVILSQKIRLDKQIG